MKPQPISTAPKDGTEILMYARWDWDSMGNPTDKHHWQVAEYDAGDFEGDEESGFLSVQYSPYYCKAVDPACWMPLPDVKIKKMKNKFLLAALIVPAAMLASIYAGHEWYIFGMGCAVTLAALGVSEYVREVKNGHSN